MFRQSAQQLGGRGMHQHIDPARFLFGWSIPTSREAR
jgi:hypothetical protein